MVETIWLSEESLRRLRLSPSSVSPADMCYGILASLWLASVSTQSLQLWTVKHTFALAACSTLILPSSHFCIKDTRFVLLIISLVCSPACSSIRAALLSDTTTAALTYTSYGTLSSKSHSIQQTSVYQRKAGRRNFGTGNRRRRC